MLRRSRLLIVSALWLVVSGSALAQDANTARSRLADDQPAEENGDETESEGEEVGFGGDEVRTGGADVGGDTPSSAPESYTVQPGDTLWNLSQRFLNNPWYWPKIWSYNPQLDNPNWIRPGTVLRFYPGESVVVEAPPEDETEIEDIGEGGGFDPVKGTIDRTDVGDGSRRRDFFIPADRLDDQGRLLNSPEEKTLLSEADRAYLKLKKGGPGDTFQIYRKERELRNPITGANVGQMVTLVGEVRVDQTGKDKALGTITTSWDPIERGQYLDNLPVENPKVVPVENTKNVKAYVVDAAPNALSFMGDQYVIVLDKGSADGVQVGNTFTVVRTGDPYTREYSGMEDEDIGRILVIETFKNASTGLLVNASREVVPGDRAEMRTK